MSRINSKAKGNLQELKISKILSQSLAPLEFKRVPSSGAFLGGRNSYRIEDFNQSSAEVFVGDIFCSNDTIRFIIESKSYKEPVKFYDLLNPSCQIYKWYNEAKVDCKKFKDKEPILIFKYNRTDNFVCIDYNLIKGLVSKENIIIVNNLCILTLTNLLQLGVLFWKN